MGKFLESQLTSPKNVLIKKHVKSNHNVKKQVKKVESKIFSSEKLKRKISESAKDDRPTKRPKINDDPQQEGEYEELEEQSEDIQDKFRKTSVIFKQLEESNEYVLAEDTEVDLFCTDEYNGRFDQYSQFNLMFKIFDEIALEGLDGITLEALWKRLKHSLKYPTVLDNIRDTIWRIICLDHRIKFYKLPEPRGELVVASTGVMSETGHLREVYMPNIYKFGLPPKDSTDLGSCVTYATRNNITSEVQVMTYFEAYYKYGNKLVIVADQAMRSFALFDCLADPTWDILPTEYCVLEKIGRSRDIGEFTQGVHSISSVFNMDPRTTYYYKNSLIQKKLITSQKMILRILTDHTRTCQLLHLRRFYNQRKSKLQLMTENIVNFLKTQPNYRITRRHLQERFHVTRKNLKYLCTTQFSRYVSFTTVPYRVLYPEAKPSEYSLKNKKNEERQVQVVELVDPYLNITFEDKNDSSDEEDNTEESTIAIGTKSMNVDLMRDVYLSIWQKGLEGESIRGLNSRFNLTPYTLRFLLRKLSQKKFIEVKKMEAGKTKISSYVATCHFRDKNITEKSTDVSKPTTTNNILARLKAKQQKAIESSNIDRIYTEDNFRRDQENRFENNLFLPVVFSVPNVKCTYLVTRFISPPSVNQIENSFQPTFFEVRKCFDQRLGYLRYDSHEIIEISRIWSKFHEITEHLPVEVKQNFRYVYENKRQIDEMSMQFLLRALFEEIEINKPDILNMLDTTGYFAEKAENSAVEETEKPIATGSGVRHAFNFMGPDPTTVFKETKNDVEVEILQSTSPKKGKIVDVKNYRPSWAVIDRTADRARKIIEIVLEHRVIDEIYKLTREICVLEAKEGYTKKLDRKTVLRLLKSLAEDGILKILVLNLKRGDLVKTKTFVCALDETYLNSSIQSQMDQLIHKYFISKPVFKDAPQEAKASDSIAGPSTADDITSEVEIEGVKVKKSPFVVSDVVASISQLKELRKDIETTEKVPRRDAYFSRRYYGLKQKFVRMSILHEVLFYLIYEQPKNATQLTKSEIEELFRDHQISLSREDLDSLPPVYCKEISWKTFVPPLPTHLGWPEGWALVCDVILRLPLSILLKIFNCTFASYELVEAISHPIKRFFLLGYNSDHIKGILTQRRKFIFDIYHTVCHLAYCGLVQFGPTKLFQKDQVFIYLNRNASLLKTITSAPGYHKVEDREYPRISFTFNTVMDVRQYWSTMYEIGMSTKLNSFKAVKGRMITLYTPNTKPDLQRALNAKTIKKAIECDNGEIPGDHRGACGLDSSLWVHKAVNWHAGGIAQNIPKTLRSSLIQEKLEIQSKSVDYNSLQQTDRLPKKVFLPKKAAPTHPKTKRTLVKPTKDRQVRTMLHRGYIRRAKRSYHDQKDLAILKKVRPSNGGRIRHQWTPEEDRILILLKVASILLSKTLDEKQNVVYTTIRDVLHHMSPVSAKTKTSRAVERRFKLIFQKYKELSKIEMNIPNLYKLEPIKRYIKPLMEQIANKENPLKLTAAQYSIAYLFLMPYICKNIKEVESALQGAIVSRINYLSEGNIQDTEDNLLPFNQKNLTYTEPTTSQNIIVDTLKATLISALCCRAQQNDSLWSYQVFSTYRKFKNIDIKQALDELLSLHFISKRKFEKKSVMRFVLSTHYIYNQNTTYSFKIVEEVYRIFDAVTKNSWISTKEPNAHVPERMALGELATFWWANLAFKLPLPDYMLILDPTVEDHSEIIEELAKRYQIKLKNDLELRAIKETHDRDNQSTEIKTEPLDLDIIDITDEYEEEQSSDLTFKSGNTVNMTDLRNWIEGYSEDLTRSRSPSPERLINREPVESTSQTSDAQAQEISESREECLSIVEIKEEMMKPPSSSTKKRSVPYILDMIDLLSENFEEIDSDESQRDVLKKHFVAQFPILKGYSVENCDEFKNHHLVRFLEDKLRIENTWKKIRNLHIVGSATPLEEVYESLIQNGGSQHDISLVDDIIGLVVGKEFMGIAATELKERFANSTENLPLDHLLTVLTNHNILIQTGVCSITFVYHLYKTPWLLDVTVMSDEDTHLIEKTKEKTENQEKVEKIYSGQTIDVKMFPWIQIDGKLNTVLCKIWLTNVLSHCVENPKLWFRSLCEKYFMVKPVDLYFLLEILRELECLEICRFETQNTNILQQWKPSKECHATFLDDFDSIFIEPSTICFSALGSLLSSSNIM